VRLTPTSGLSARSAPSSPPAANAPSRSSPTPAPHPSAPHSSLPAFTWQKAAAQWTSSIPPSPSPPLRHTARRPTVTNFSAPKGGRLAGRQPDGSVLVTTNQSITPLGTIQEVARERPKDLAVSPDGSLVAVLTTGKVHFFKPDGTLDASVSVKPGPLGLAW